MSTHFDKELTPEPAQRTMGSLGTLILINRKTGEDVQSFPIDGDRVSIGRDWECHVRLYFPDVSKRHAEIVFDLLTNRATLAVLGNNGIQHGSSRSRLTKHSPPTVINLTDKDVFTVRNKYFRFEYGSFDTLNDVTLSPETPAQRLADEDALDVVRVPQQVKNSPKKARKSVVEAALAEPLRRQQSHRLSLVPAGRTFEPMTPMKNRRQSTIGLVHASAVAQPAHSSAEDIVEADEEMEQAEDEEANVEIDIVDVVEGEDGDVVYMEVQTPAKAQPIYERAFMTPQQVRRVEMRNTSVVPRTRKMAPLPQRAHDRNPTEDANAEDELEDDEEAMLIEPVQSTVPPKTPRSIPLPASADTPYAGAMQTPAPPRVPQNVALSTPKGPVTLRKALLVHSARKAWESTRTPGVEGAIEQGTIETRKPRKSGTPVKIVEEEGGGDGEVDEEEEEEQLEVVQDEEKQVEEEQEPLELSLEEQAEEGVSGSSSLEADLSLDVVHQEDLELPDVKEVMNDELAVEEKPIISSTPARRTVLGLATPARGAATPQRSLASIGGPAVRFQRLPGTPQAVSGVHIAPAAPGTMGRPQRRVQPKTDSAMLATPARPRSDRTVPDARLVAEVKRQRESLATPRQLPAAPAGGFRDFVREPVKQTPLKLLHRTPAKTPARQEILSPEPDDAHAEASGPRTPLDDIRARLVKMRRDSEVRQGQGQVQATGASRDGRRATVGFTLPATPAQKNMSAVSANYTAVNKDTKRTFALPQPKTPLVEAQGGEEVSSLIDSPPATTSDTELLAPTLAFSSKPAAAIAPRIQAAKPAKPAPATPSYAGMRNMLNTPKPPPKTPYMRDLSRMYPTTTTSAAPAAGAGTPSFRGVREMMHLPKEATTPSFRGVRNLFVQPRVARTPGMEGVEEMYALPETEAPVQDEAQVDSVMQSAQVGESGEVSEQTHEHAEEDDILVPDEGMESATAVQIAEQDTLVEEAVGPRKKAAATKPAAANTRSAPSRGRKTPAATAAAAMAANTTTTASSARSAPTRAKRMPTVEPEISSATVSKPTRATRAATRELTVEPAAEQDELSVPVPSLPAADPVVKKAMATKIAGKATVSRASRKPFAAPLDTSASSKTRTKSALTEMHPPEQPEAERVEEDVKPAAARARRTAAAKKAEITSAASVSPVKRGRGGKTKAVVTAVAGEGEKENIPTDAARGQGELEGEEEEKPEVLQKKAPVKRGRKAVAPETAAPAATTAGTRTTRARR